MALRYYSATAEDTATIKKFLAELAEAEGIPGAVSATKQDIADMLLGPDPFAEAFLAWHDDRPVGMVIFCIKPSTYRARRALYIEDIVITSSARGQGFGRMLMKQVVKLARSRGCWRLEWSVVDANHDAVAFYEALGAEPELGRTHYEMEI